MINVFDENDVLHLYLDEEPYFPEGFPADRFSPNGFYPESLIRDFPLRDRKVMLHIRRWCWVDQTTGKSVFRSWKLVADGTQYTKEFASFLKDMLGFISDYDPLS